MQSQWRAIMGTNPQKLSFPGCDQCPVENISWQDVQDFIKVLNQKTRKKYRLPSEAEWEFAATGGVKSRGYKYAGSNDFKKVGWGGFGNFFFGAKTHPVGYKEPNELGIYDMCGHVFEYCQDLWHDNYKGAPTDGTPWINGGKAGRYVKRGGSFLCEPQVCRVRSSRNDCSSTTDSSKDTGFRLAHDI